VSNFQQENHEIEENTIQNTLLIVKASAKCFAPTDPIFSYRKFRVTSVCKLKIKPNIIFMRIQITEFVFNASAKYWLAASPIAFILRSSVVNAFQYNNRIKRKTKCVRKLPCYFSRR